MMSEKRKLWYKNNPTKSSEYSRRHRLKNKENRYLQVRLCMEKRKEYYKEINHKYYLEHKEQLARLNKEWQRNNPEKSRAIKRRWNLTHQAERNFHVSQRRAKLLLMGKFTTKEWHAIKIAYKSICQICKRQEPDIKLTIDHIIPISRGGLHIKENIQPLCASCNSKKNNKLMEELNV